MATRDSPGPYPKLHAKMLIIIWNVNDADIHKHLALQRMTSYTCPTHVHVDVNITNARGWFSRGQFYIISAHAVFSGQVGLVPGKSKEFNWKSTPVPSKFFGKPGSHDLNAIEMTQMATGPTWPPTTDTRSQVQP